MSVKNGMRPVHPGEILREELEDLGLSANAVAKALDVPANRISAILNGRCGITADTALRLFQFFFWHFATDVAQFAGNVRIKDSRRLGETVVLSSGEIVEFCWRTYASRFLPLMRQNTNPANSTMPLFRRVVSPVTSCGLVISCSPA